MKALVWTAALLLSAAAAASCGGGDGPTEPSGGGGGGPLTISIAGGGTSFTFSPNPADAGGRAVVFRNNTAEVHRVILNDNSIDTGDIAPGATSRSVTMPAAGTNYHCSLHDRMGGAVLPASGGAPPPCEGVYCY